MTDNPTRDPRPEDPRPCCLLCATWVCHECWDWHRKGANRFGHQYCTKCGGIKGEFVAVRHLRHHHHMRPFRPFRVPTELPTGIRQAQGLYFSYEI